MKFFYKKLLTTILTAFVGGNALPQIVEKDITFKSESFKTLIIESILPYLIREYQKPILVDFKLSPSEVNYSSPENTVVAAFSAMNLGDFDWFEKIWIKSSIEFNRALDAKNKITKDKWINQWKTGYAKKHITLTKRLDYEKFVIVVYEVRQNAQDPILENDSLILVKENNQWFLTQELAKNPITYAWKITSNRIQVGSETYRHLQSK